MTAPCCGGRWRCGRGPAPGSRSGRRRGPPGPAAGPAQLLFAGVVDHAVVVLLHDGLRVVRYAEAADAEGRSDGTGAALDFARADGASAASASALVLNRTQLQRPLSGGALGDVGATRWICSSRMRRAPGWRSARTASPCRPLPLPPTRSARRGPRCGWGGRLLTDLGELAPARLTYGSPGKPGEVKGPKARAAWARTACHLPAVRGQGVRTVNSWEFAEQPVPGGAGTAAWVCTRAETWRGAGSRTLAQFQAPAPGGQPYAPGAVAARAEAVRPAGPRPRVLAGVLWKAPDGRWWLLAAGSKAGLLDPCDGRGAGRGDGALLAVPSKAGDRAELDGQLADGKKIRALR